MTHRKRNLVLQTLALMLLVTTCLAQSARQLPGAQQNTIRPASGPAYSPEYGVRFVYLVPKNRQPQDYAVRNMKEWAKIVRSFYGQELAKYGFYKPGTTEGKTFACDEDENGDPFIHVIYGTENDYIYADSVFGACPAEAAKHFDAAKSVFCIFPECYNMGEGGVITGGAMGGTTWGNGSGEYIGGIAVIGGDTLWLLEKAKWSDNRPYDGMCLPWFNDYPLVFGVSYPGFQGPTVGENSGVFYGAAAHELGHGFGISHCFCAGDTVPGVPDLMGNGCRTFRGIYGGFPEPGSSMCKWDCEFVAQSPFFNPGRPRIDITAPTETEEVTVEHAGTPEADIHAKLTAKDTESGLFRNVISFLPAGSQCASTEYDADGKADIRIYKNQVPVNHLDPKSYVFFFRPFDNMGNWAEHQTWVPIPTSLNQQYRDVNGVWKDIAIGGQAGNGNLRLVLSLVGPQDYCSVKPEIEIRPVGTPFNGVPNVNGPTMNYSNTGQVTAIIVLALEPGKYHWRYRIRSSNGNFPLSCWVVPGVDDPATADIEVPAIPSFITQPKSQTKCVGQPLTLSVQAIGAQPLYYQWMKDNTDIPGATNPTYKVDSVTMADAGTYTCRIWNYAGSLTSEPAVIGVVNSTPAQITKQPIDQYAYWYRGYNVAEYKPVTASHCFRLNSTESITDGVLEPNPKWTTYTCGVNAEEWVEIDLQETCSISAINAYILDDDSGVLTPESVEYYYKNTAGEWKLLAVDGAPIGTIDGSKTTTMLFPTVDATAVRITLKRNPAVPWYAGVGLSEVEVLSGCVGKSVTFSAAATGSEPITYQWRKDGVDIPGATGSSFTIPTALPVDAGAYECVVRNVCTEQLSAPAILTVQDNLAPIVTRNPESKVVPAGTRVEMSLEVESIVPCTYQWMKEYMDIPGATGKSFVIPSCKMGDTGSYACAITSLYGFNISGSADLFVASPVKLSEVKSLSSGSRIALKSCSVTAAFDSEFYAEDTSRTTGIKVTRWGHGLKRGDLVDIGGYIRGGAGQEAYIDASAIVRLGTESIKPLMVSGISLGGSSRGIQDPVWSWRWVKEEDKMVLKWLPAAGLNNIGLHVRVFGRVTQVDPDGSYFYIDDGSVYKDGTMTGDEENRGVRVALEGRNYMPGQFIIVNGISSCILSDNCLIRLIKVEKIEDIEELESL